MNVTVTKGRFGTSVQFTQATPEEVGQVLGLLGLLAQAPDTDDSKPFIGQRLLRSDAANWPKGIRVVQEAGHPIDISHGATFLGFSESGTQGQWVSTLLAALDPPRPASWDTRYWAAVNSGTDEVVVREVW